MCTKRTISVTKRWIISRKIWYCSDGTIHHKRKLCCTKMHYTWKWFNKVDSNLHHYSVGGIKMYLKKETKALLESVLGKPLKEISE